MATKLKPAQGLRREMTEEEKKEQLKRAYLQKRAALAEGILFNLLQSCGRDLCYDLENNQTKDNPKKIVKMSKDMAEAFMDEVYDMRVSVESNTEE